VVSLAILTDDDPDYKPDRYSVNRWRFDLTMAFPVVKIIDYKDRLAELEQSTNPMALVVAAQLKSLEAKKTDTHTKYDVKLQLFKDCFKKGYSKNQIYILVKFIDWIINLPEKYQEKLNEQLLILKEDNIMPYITSWERIAKKKGKVEGIKETKLETAKKMLMDGLSTETIIKYTGLAKIEIKRLMQGTAIPLHENR
jgi:predicted transposase/invertase (TIGR01784 family)